MYTCCRTHDHCPHVIHAFSSNYGYTNFKWHSICHCDCDEELKACLRQVNDTSSRVVGQAFFNVIGVPCFDFAYEDGRNPSRAKRRSRTSSPPPRTSSRCSPPSPRLKAPTQTPTRRRRKPRRRRGGRTLGRRRKQTGNIKRKGRAGRGSRKRRRL
uniref:Phospholipase A2-like central domain-containing protein n=1 Tax=Xiphophorus couchianus TaxID=32473 RepID=A0A3B5LTA9_9TELE